MDEIQKAKRDSILYSLGFCIGLATLLIDTIPVIAIGAIIFCPYYAVKSFRKYRKLELQLRVTKHTGFVGSQEYFPL